MDVSGVRPSSSWTFSNDSLKPLDWFFYFTYSIYRYHIGGGNEKLFFCSNRSRTLIAMVAYSSHRLIYIMGKEKNNHFFLSHWEYFDFFLHKCILSSFLSYIWLLSKSVNLIGCRGGEKGHVSETKFLIYLNGILRKYRQCSLVLSDTLYSMIRTRHTVQRNQFLTPLSFSLKINAFTVQDPK